MVALTHEAIVDFIEGRRGWTFPLSAIRQFVPGDPLETIIIDFMTNPSVPGQQRTLYGMHLLSGFAEVLEKWGSQGVELAKVYSSGGTRMGRHLLESAGFVFLGSKGETRNIYELDVPTAKIQLL